MTFNEALARAQTGEYVTRRATIRNELSTLIVPKDYRTADYKGRECINTIIVTAFEVSCRLLPPVNCLFKTGLWDVIHFIPSKG